MDKETCRWYDDIKTSSALLKRIREKSTKMMKKDTESTENELFTLKLKEWGMVRSYNKEMRMVWEDLESCGQPRPTDYQKYQNPICGLPTTLGEYKRILRWNVKDNDYLGLLLKLEKYKEELRQAKRFESVRDFFAKNCKNQIQKNSKKMDVSEIACCNCWIKGCYAKHWKYPKQPKLKKNYNEKHSKKE